MPYSPPNIQDRPATVSSLSANNLKLWLSDVATYAETVASATVVLAAQDPSGDWWSFTVAEDGSLLTTNVGSGTPSGSAPYASLSDVVALRNLVGVNSAITPGVVNLDAGFTLTPFTSPATTRHIGTLTAARTVTLTTAGAQSGMRYRVLRTGGGAFPLNVGPGPLKALSTGQWCDVEYDGAAWFLSAFGSL